MPITDTLFDDFIHVRPRLTILVRLARGGWVEFTQVRQSVGCSDSALSKQVSALQEAGYTEVCKMTERRRRRTWIRLTEQGRSALLRHLDALERLAAQVRGPVSHRRP
ncbi:transcriptional regulator [Streptomonospora salina]|uniref:DNA-binding MarR family transcriptional regulator n=1 Tax=Streptomonospora salina TaxID=104205 RepID=A0A841E734_9ACTN|nr:transcriptional regulator [Streptomonospora salina]MBB5998652.1 DNA-binding MarR family transcriptional regulator [Streptomonospora salina]